MKFFKDFKKFGTNEGIHSSGSNAKFEQFPWNFGENNLQAMVNENQVKFSLRPIPQAFWRTWQ